ncbi:hypothetical protein [Verrucomicrobium spinosum]|uniref:hypothetical protein n=1 Tax=Verrucomicrobium spinosum TaxID=2736 RepID=UPI00094638A8|nr:hypothetical protein [Verrucomicrobium spinosum]
MQIYAEDLEHAVWQKVPLPATATQFRDERLTRNLDPASPFTETKETTVLQKGQTLVLDDILTSEVESYDTLGGVYSLLKTLNTDPNVAEFAWILQWPQYSDAEKRAKYGEYASHELHLFLAKKDPAFFTKVVKPYLANKKDKTFMDEFLLDARLDRYLEPWRYSRLNVVERALLAQRLPGEAARAARHLRESWELLPLDPEGQDRYFETALRGRSLDGTDKSLWADTESSKLVPLAIEAPAPAPAPTTAAAAAPADRFSGSVGRLSEMGDPSSTPAISQRAARGLSIAGKKDSAGEEMAEKQKEQAGREMMVAQGKPLELTANFEGQYTYAGVALQADAQHLVRSYFRELGPAREWAENNYYKLRQTDQNASLVTVNAFWRDFATWIAEGPKAPSSHPMSQRPVTPLPRSCWRSRCWICRLRPPSMRRRRRAAALNSPLAPQCWCFTSRSAPPPVPTTRQPANCWSRSPSSAPMTASARKAMNRSRRMSRMSSSLARFMEPTSW